MSQYIYVYMYACVHIDIYIKHSTERHYFMRTTPFKSTNDTKKSLQVYVFACMYVYVCMSTVRIRQMRTRTHTRMQAYMHTQTFSSTHPLLHVMHNTHTHTPIRTRTRDRNDLY